MLLGCNGSPAVESDVAPVGTAAGRTDVAGECAAALAVASEAAAQAYEMAAPGSLTAASCAAASDHPGVRRIDVSQIRLVAAVAGAAGVVRCLAVAAVASCDADAEHVAPVLALPDSAAHLRPPLQRAAIAASCWLDAQNWH